MLSHKGRFVLFLKGGVMDQHGRRGVELVELVGWGGAGRHIMLAAKAAFTASASGKKKKKLE